MVTKTVKVVNEQGMHMRPAGVLAQEMKKFAVIQKDRKS